MKSIVMHVIHDNELTFPFQENTLFKGLDTTPNSTPTAAVRASYLEAVVSFLESTRKAYANGGRRLLAAVQRSRARRCFSWLLELPPKQGDADETIIVSHSEGYFGMGVSKALGGWMVSPGRIFVGPGRRGRLRAHSDSLIQSSPLSDD